MVLEDEGSETEAIAGLLHDCAEDHGGEAMLGRIEEEFDAEVAEIVRGCSDSLLSEDAEKDRGDLPLRTAVGARGARRVGRRDPGARLDRSVREPPMLAEPDRRAAPTTDGATMPTWSSRRPIPPDIPVYTRAMKVVKVRRVGNSNVVSIPRELEERGYAPGTSVLIEELEGGELRIMPTAQVRERIRAVGRRVISEHGEALRILAEHDPAATRSGTR